MGYFKEGSGRGASSYTGADSSKGAARGGVAKAAASGLSVKVQEYAKNRPAGAAPYRGGMGDNEFGGSNLNFNLQNKAYRGWGIARKPGDPKED